MRQKYFFKLKITFAKSSSHNDFEASIMSLTSETILSFRSGSETIGLSKMNTSNLKGLEYSSGVLYSLLISF